MAINKRFKWDSCREHSLCTDFKGKVSYQLLVSVRARAKGYSIKSRDYLNVAQTGDGTAFETLLWFYTAAYLAGRDGLAAAGVQCRVSGGAIFPLSTVFNRIPVATVVDLEFAN